MFFRMQFPHLEFSYRPENYALKNYQPFSFIAVVFIHLGEDEFRRFISKKKLTKTELIKFT